MNTANPLPEVFAALSIHNQQEPLQEILTRVSPKRDRLTDDDHRSLDERLMKTHNLGVLRRFNLQPDWPGLLSGITVDDKRLVTLATQEAEELLSKRPPINEVLQKAWENNNSFKEVRQLSILWPVVEETPKRSLGQSNEDPELTIKAVKSAWRDPYAGTNHHLLFDNINGFSRTEKPYSNQIAIVQSSGTGKSRMVHEQANLVFTIPFNLRDVNDSQDLAFPAPDDAVRDYFLKTVSNEHELKTNYLNFLGSVFRRVYDELEKCQEALNAEKITDAGDLARWWSRHLATVRTDLYKAAVSGAGEPLKILPEIRKKHEELLAKPRSEPHLDDDDMRPIVVFAAAQVASDALEKLIRKVDSWPGSKSIKLVIYFDEAHPLTKAPKNDNVKTRYDFLCSCLNEFLASPIFCIFLSTNSSLAQFASPQALARSARIRGGKAVTHAPITETPFDCCEDLKVRQGELTVEDISTIPFMAKFGRPLFWTMLRGAGVRAPHIEKDILELACAKLIRSSSSKRSDAAKLAVLDVQLSLDFEPRRQKVQLEEASLVESHMRIAYSIPDHREYLRSGYPSEPLLAEAAARQLSTWRKENPFFVVDTLTDIFNDGLLDRGELEELTGRHLLLDAYHRAVEIEAHARNKPPNFSAGCRLITFIEALFTEECANRVLNGTPDNVDEIDGISNKFKDVFKDALVCFTHFGKMADDTGVTSTAAWAAFVRHMATMCRNGQHHVDCIIPVVLQKGRLCEHIMTGLLIQFKRRKTKGTVAAYSFDEANIRFFPKKLKECTHGSSIAKHRPYVTLIMELGVQPTLHEAATTPTIKPGTPPPTKGDLDPTTPSKMHHPITTGHSRYNVFAYGCSSTIYRGIDASYKSKYALLLNSRDFLGEHPRKSAESLKAVRRMKPFWNGGEDCYHWVEHDDILHGPTPPPTLEFGVGNEMEEDVPDEKLLEIF